MDLGIVEEVALVMGGTQGLGLACAEALAEAGATVILNGRDRDKGEAAAAAIGSNARFVAADLSRPEARRKLYDDASAVAGAPSILVTNAGGSPPGPFAEKDHDAWIAALELNMLAAVDLARFAVPAMTARGWGRVVNITSFVVREPYPNMALANAVRVGLTGAMATLAREVAGQGVTVNNILPGLMDTPALQRVFRAQSENQGITEAEARTRMAETIPVGRLGEAEDFGPLCAFLCSRHADYITAQNIAVDGGLVRGLL